MNDEPRNEQLLVDYLLGRLSEEQEQQIEELYFADDDLHEELQAVEIDLIDRYTNDELSEEEREQFEEQFFSAPGRIQDVMFAKALKVYFSEPGIAQPPGRFDRIHGLVWKLRLFFTPWRSAIATVAALALGVLVWQVFFSEPQVTRGLTALRKAYREGRPTEGRISGFSYAPALETRGDDKTVDQNEKDLAEEILLKAVTDDPSATSHHALGQFYLASKQFEKALTEFEEALKTSPANARLHNDTGVALLEIGKRYSSNQQADKSTGAFTESLKHFNKAIDMDGSILEALFNRALSYQYLNQLQQARQDWKQYIDKDPDSLWADEARSYLNSISRGHKNSFRNKEQISRGLVIGFGTRWLNIALSLCICPS